MSFAKFLHKNSAIDSKFIQDFNDIISEDYIVREKEFLIDYDKLRFWLGIKNRRAFKDNIKNTYKKNIDYQSKIIKRSKGSGGHNYEDIKLTSRCAKKICQVTKGIKGELVRQYFIDIEFLLCKYHYYISEGLKRKVKRLENNQKPKINQNKHIIYIFKALNTDATLYKLGKTTNLKNRLKSYNSSSANDIEIIFQYETENVNRVESCVKILMKKAQYRKYKEVYQIDIDILKKIIKECDANIRSIDNKIKQKGGEKGKYFMFIPNTK